MFLQYNPGSLTQGPGTELKTFKLGAERVRRLEVNIIIKNLKISILILIFLKFKKAKNTVLRKIMDNIKICEQVL